MKVSRSGYYDWLNRLPSNRAKENQEFTRAIKEVFIQNRNIYGTRRIARKLAHNNIFISRRRIGKLMAESGLYCKTNTKSQSIHKDLSN
ncbi:MAG: IS3 family transposase [Pedobacter sp.]|nr:IS3 family transposase [Pedobacter sp.]